MRFVIAFILVVLSLLLSLANAPGIEGLDRLIAYLAGTLVVPALIAALFCIPKSGRNNRRFFRAFNVIIFFLIIGSAIRFANIYARPPVDLADAGGSIQITVPASWSNEQVPNENILLHVKNRSGFMTILISFETAGSDRPELSQYAQAIGEKFQQTAPDFESRTDTRPCEDMAVDCVYQIVRTTSGEKGTQSLLASIEGKRGFYNFMAITNPGLYDNYEKDIFQALGSFKEIDG